MLLNFCDKCLRTDVTCSTINSEGYEVTNLVNGSNQGFLAYYAIKPPVYIDFSFICNIKISYIIIWPQIGAQKSCGFQLSVKTTNIKNEPFIDISTAFITKEEKGVFFYRRDLQNSADIFPPSNFAKRFIKTLDVTNFVNSLRIGILKTENSVPALGKIEIWGQASPRCGKDVVSNVMALWSNKFNNICLNTPETNFPLSNEKNEIERVSLNGHLLNIPEDFLDSITYEIMTQPIILPSGKVIDQKTLEKHTQNEAVWGRPVSDPFTGVRFNDTVKPIAAFPLKARIDKFLLENSHQEEIKKLPRVLGSLDSKKLKHTKIISCSNMNPSDSVVENNTNRFKRPYSKETFSVTSDKLCHDLPPEKLAKKFSREKVQIIRSLDVSACTGENNVKVLTNTKTKKSLANSEVNFEKTNKLFHGHVLPLVIPSKNTNFRNKKYTQNSSSLTSKSKEIAINNALIEKKLELNTKVNYVPHCKCCSSNVFYKLPCEHIICRQALTSLTKNKCTECQIEFKSSDPQRFHFTLED